MNHAQQTLAGTVVFFTLVAIYFYLSQPEYDGGPTRWARWRARYLMSREELRAAQSNRVSGDVSAVSAGETNSETSETLDIDAETREEIFSLGENTAIARLIHSGAIKLTEGVKLGTGKRSGEAYSKRSREIQELVKALENKYPNRTPEQEETRQRLDLA